jgi:hypothetical protein
MNALAFASVLLIRAVALACQSTNQAERSVGTAMPDTVRIDEQRLGQSTHFDPSQNPLSRQDAAGLRGAKGLQYTIDTLVTTDAAHVMLIGRLYPEETIGWLVTVNPTDQRLIDQQIVYYDNAEGMTETRTNWLPQQQRVIVQTGTHDEADQYRTSRIVYTVQANGKFSKIKKPR